jgi:hypothetical protein
MSIINCRVAFIRTGQALGGRDRSGYHADNMYVELDGAILNQMCLSSLRRRVVFSLFYDGYAESAAAEMSDSMSQGRSFARPPYLTPRPSSAARGCAGNISLATQPRPKPIERAAAQATKGAARKL